MRIFCVLSYILFTAATLCQASPPSYNIQAKIDVKRNLISGREALTLTNSTASPLRELSLFLYPNKFQSKSPQLNEMNYRWHYPSGFDEGYLRVTSVQDASSGQSMQGEPVDPDGLPPGTAYRIRLAEPLPPGAELSLTIDFECKIPHKYGPFGHFRNTITAQGGWYPYLVATSQEGRPLFDSLPQESSFQAHLSLNAKRDVLLNGRFYDDATEIDFSPRQGRYLSMVVAPRFYPSKRSAAGKTVIFYSLFKERYKLEKVLKAFSNAAEQADTFAQVGTPKDVVVVETYLRAVMSFPGDGMILVSDRFLVTVEKFDFRNLNRLEAARAVGRSFVVDEAVKRESPSDYNWVAEALAWGFRNEYLRTNFKDLSNLRDTAGRMGMFRPFNRMAASPTIPFSETYVGDVINRDPLRESLLYFNNALPSGQLFAEKLSATLGEESYLKAIRGYLSQGKDFQSFVTEVAGRDMSWFFEQWKKGYPPGLDYRLAGVERNMKSGNKYLTRFTVEKTTTRNLIDPVEVRVTEESGNPSRLVWDGRGTSKTFEIETDGKVTLIEIDPRNHTVQTDVQDDLSPHHWEMVMDRGDVDVGTGGLGAGMRIRMHRARDRSRWMFVLPFFSNAEFGVEAGMLFDFGGTVKGLVWNRKQELSLSYILTNLRGGFADRESGRNDGVGQASGLKFRYTFQDKMFEEDPMNYESFEFSGALYRDELGGDFNFFRANVTASKSVALHPKHKLAGVVSVGYSDGFRSKDEVPAQKLFDLAGFPFIGFSGPGRFLEENVFATSLEWRHDLMSNLNMSMPMNNRIRRVQGVLAFDVGWLSPHFDELFRLNRAIYGVRYGLRFHYDFLGIRPSNFTVDIGYRLGDGARDGGAGFVVGLGILQTF